MSVVVLDSVLFHQINKIIIIIKFKVFDSNLLIFELLEFSNLLSNRFQFSFEYSVFS